MPTIAGWIAKGKWKNRDFRPPARLPVSIRWEDDGPFQTADLNATSSYIHTEDGRTLFRFFDGSALVFWDTQDEGEEVKGTIPGPWVDL